MKIVIFTSPAVTAQVNEWLAEHPDIEVIAMSQSEFESTIHLSLLYKEKQPAA
ncbi:MAG TPA: hypothetical protein VLE43_18215 [Candidatus Saccharimonadia bacterium]|nr:hypothetical protein [Candidatus Saccharimonadia bacterium]